MSTEGTAGLILTLTANPSVDRALHLAGPLHRDAVLRAESELEQAGGKGVNISRAAVAAGIETEAVLPCDPDSDFVRELTAAGIRCVPVGCDGPIRVNLTITEPDGTTTKINSRGVPASAALLERLSAAMTDRARSASWAVLAGSLPPDAPDAWYADLTATLRPMTKVAVDTSGPPLEALRDRLSGDAPHLLKPNAEELAVLTGTTVTTPEDAADSARMLVDKGVETVLASLGAGGAVLVDRSGAWHASAPPVTVLSTVGAGDCGLFGYLLGDSRQAGPEERLRLAVAYGSAAAGLRGTTIPGPEQVHPERVTVRRL